MKSFTEMSEIWSAIPKNMGPLISHTRTLFWQLAQMRDFGIFVAVIRPAFDFGFFADHLHGCRQ